MTVENKGNGKQFLGHVIEASWLASIPSKAGSRATALLCSALFCAVLPWTILRLPSVLTTHRAQCANFAFATGKTDEGSGRGVQRGSLLVAGPCGNQAEATRRCQC